MTARGVAVVVAIGAAACPGPNRPAPPTGSLTLEVGREGGSLRGVAGDGSLTFTATTMSEAKRGGGDPDGARTLIEARRGSSVVWQVDATGIGGSLARAGALLAVTLVGTGTVADAAMRGEPGAIVVAVDAATGAARWKVAIDSNEWSLITAIAPTSAGFVIGGTFSGTLRAADKVVSSAGKNDGFVARVDPAGKVAWLVRIGGANADAIQGVAASASGDRIAIAGTFAPGAELLGEPLTSISERMPTTDVFVAELDPNGARRWSTTFGSSLDDAVAGVAIDGRGRIAVATTARESSRINLADVVAQGPADGLVTWFAADGTAGPSVVLGGPGFDGMRAITATAGQVVVAGFYSGTIRIGGETLTSTAGSDDVYLAALDGDAVTKLWPIAGVGREEITALAPVPGGFIAGIAHTAAASIDGQPLAAPNDPMGGAAIVVRAAR